MGGCGVSFVSRPKFQGWITSRYVTVLMRKPHVSRGCIHLTHIKGALHSDCALQIGRAFPQTHFHVAVM